MKTATYDETTVDTILCVWDAMLDERTHNNEASPPSEWHKHFNKLWDDYGTASMRGEARSIGEWCEQVFDAYLGDNEYEGPPWDFEIVPALLRLVDFSDDKVTIPSVESGSVVVHNIVEIEKAAHAKAHWTMRAREIARVEYADDGSIFDADQLERLREQDMSPREAVEHVANKYDLIRVTGFFRSI